MTEQKAIEQIKSIPFIRLKQKQCDALEMSIQALEKQIPKVPINKTKPNNGVAQHYENCHIIICPSCGRRLKLKSKGNYCDKCGQAIKWE